MPALQYFSDGDTSPQSNSLGSSIFAPRHRVLSAARSLLDSGLAECITDRRPDIAGRSRERPAAGDALGGLRIHLLRDDSTIPRACREDLEGHRAPLLEPQVIGDRPAGGFRHPIAARQSVRLAGG